MDVFQNIKDGKYKTRVFYDIPEDEITDDMTVGQMKALKVSRKEREREQRRLYNEDCYRLMNEFRKDLAEEAGLTNHPKEKKLFSIAYNIGHSGGFHEIHSHYLELAELL